MTCSRTILSLLAVLFCCARALHAQARPQGAPECTRLAEPAETANSNTVWVGLVTDVTNRPLRQLAAELARHEIALVGGLPPSTPGGARRTFGLVACNSALGIDSVFAHLMRLRVPAVIGPQYSGDALHALTTYTLPAGAVMLATNATAAVLTTVPSRGLFLRMLASDAYQADALAQFVTAQVEPHLRADGVVPSGQPMKVFVAYKADAYGSGVADRVSRRLSAGARPPNRALLRRATYGDPMGDGAADLRDSVVTAILGMRPHVIAIAGSLETQKVIESVERGWPAGVAYRPVWVGTDGVGVVAARMPTPDGTFARRFYTTNLRIDFDGPLARHILSTIGAAHPELLRQDPRSGTALATYDAVYAMAYAVAALRSRPITGPNLAAALRRLNRPGAPVIELGPGSTVEVYARLQRHQPFDIAGASGAMDWDRHGDVLQDVDILCTATATDTQGSPRVVGTRASGLYYAVRQRRLVGKLVDCPGP